MCVAAAHTASAPHPQWVPPAICKALWTTQMGGRGVSLVPANTSRLQASEKTETTATRNQSRMKYMTKRTAVLKMHKGAIRAQTERGGI